MGHHEARVGGLRPRQQPWLPDRHDRWRHVPTPATQPLAPRSPLSAACGRVDGKDGGVDEVDAEGEQQQQHQQHRGIRAHGAGECRRRRPLAQLTDLISCSRMNGDLHSEHFLCGIYFSLFPFLSISFLQRALASFFETSSFGSRAGWAEHPKLGRKRGSGLSRKDLGFSRARGGLVASCGY